MDSYWQVKCGSTLQSSMPMPSTSQETRNQMESGHFCHPHFGLDLRSQVHGRIPDPTIPNIPNLISYSSGQTELGNSFLALLSGPASLLQCDFQELSNSKPFSTFSKLPIEGSTIAVPAIGSRNQLTSSGLLSENVSHQNLRNGADVCPIVSSITRASSNSGNDSVLQFGLQAANFNLQSSDLAKAAIHHMVPGNENIKDFSSLRVEWPSTNPPNSVKLHNTSGQTPPKRPLEIESSVSDNSSNFTGACPRVFCSSTSGNLLLSNTGLLGILCSCHCFHMSVSKFCEHSGLWNVNPGDTVCMESGETIAQWRKLYFQKFQIRVPEDQSGWDWPEGLSLTASLVKSSLSMPTSKNSDCNIPVVGPSEGFVRSRQPIDSPIFPKKSLAEQNSVIDAFHNKQQRNGQDGVKFLGLVDTSQSNSHVLGDEQMTDGPISRCLAGSKFVSGPENGCQSISAYIEDIVKTGSLSSTNHSLQNLRAILNGSDVNRAKDEKDGVIVDKDTASSSIELRLGQPKQQSQKPFPKEQIIHYVTSFGGEGRMEESRQWLPCAAGASTFTTTGEQNHLNYGHCAISNAMDVAKLDKLKGARPKTLVFSPFRHFKAPPTCNLHSEVTNNADSISEHIIPEPPHCESHAVKCNPVNIPWNGGNGLDRQWTVPEFSIFRPTDKGKGVGYLNGNSYTEAGSGAKMHKCMENPSSFIGLVGGNSYSGFPAMHDKKNYSNYLSSMPPNAPDPACLSSYLEDVSCFGSNGHIDHVFPRSMGSEKFLPSQAASLCFPSSSSKSIQGLTPGLLKQESTGVSPYLLDDNLRLLALRQILELSKQQQVMSSLGKNLKQGRCENSSNVKVQHSHVEPSESGEQRHEPNLTGKQDVSEVVKSIRSGPTSKMGNRVDKFTPLIGLNNWCNFSTLAQGIPLHCKETDTQCQLSYDCLQNEQPSLRLGRSENNITHSNEHESRCQMTHCFKGYCSCAAHAKCLGGQCELKGGDPLNPFSEQMGCVSGKTPVLIASQFDKDHIVPKETIISLDQCGKLKGQLPKNISCHTCQWKDVPSKVKRVCEVACVKQSADVLNGRGHEMDKLGDATVKCSNEAVHMADFFKEQEISNISSGCSTPAVTQASIEVNNMDSSTVVAGNTGYVNNLVVDEGSGIDKCWSSDDALESDRSADFYGSTCKTSLRKDASFKVINNQSSRSLLDEVKLMDSLTWKRGQNQIHTATSVNEKTSHSQESERGLKTRKRKREMKLKVLDASLGTTGSAVLDKYPECVGTAECLSKDVQMVSSGRETSQKSAFCSIKPSSKHGKSTLSLARPLSRKRDLRRLYMERDGQDCYETEQNNNANSHKILEVSGKTKFRSSGTADGCIQSHAGGEQIVDCDTVSCMKASSSQQENVFYRKARPVVSGKYGELSNGEMAGNMSKPAKIVSLDRILKTARRCTPPRNCKPRLTFQKDLNRTSFGWSNDCLDKFFSLKKKNGSNDALGCEEMNAHNSVKKRENAPADGDKHSADEFSMSEKEQGNKSGKYCSILDTIPCAHTKPKFKEIRRRSLYELTLKGKNSSSEMISHKHIFNHALKAKVGKILKNSKDSKCRIRGSRKVNAKRYIQGRKHLSLTDSDSFCCVCGSSNKDELNCLLECGRCLIKVHQACYGVSKVPKSHWYCRPCRTSSKNIVCVLCGYGGGAMTRALQSRTIVKSLLKAWSFQTEGTPKNAISSAGTVHDELSMFHSSGSVLENNSYPVLRPVNIEPSTSAVWNMDMKNKFDHFQNSLCCVSNLKVRNSITTGVLDSTVKQWVHMVCGLWTPGTRCPNVDTMSAFDVSGASHPRENMVCSMCNRPGGSCIQCRVVNCSVQFHPWCAHQKGLLQSEVEGVDNEYVGFYGRCVLHATYATDESACDATNVEESCPGEKEENCARTEGFKGRKRDGFWHNLCGQSKGKGGCHVPQEQLNAWIHINGQKSCTQALSKLPMSDMEYDCRKEYARYKQAKGWKHLVVYKSGIHALGLYTSRFISRGEMVVEYVGEIVGLRVADKRENEYQSGRKLQYKSACYFFRIDKEHIIDATQKGGIARFVNHSCLPNCAAKVISVRNEKKVVFFAERDIYPGEEITYDYHFNHEDEGKKIPCFCNSKNCRRYLN